MNIQALMKQANEMQRKIAKAEKEIEAKVYEKTLGGGAISLKITGSLELKELKIDEDLLEKDNKEMVEEMLLSGLNEVIAQAKAEKDEVMNGLTGGVKFPGGF